jgi:hypothetical protein
LIDQEPPIPASVTIMRGDQTCAEQFMRGVIDRIDRDRATRIATAHLADLLTGELN